MTTSASARVCAVVPSPMPRSLEGALAAQTAPVADRSTGTGSWHAAVATAPAAEWLWLLDGHVVPAPDALERLLTALGAGDGSLPAPALLASKVVRPSGGLDRDSAPWPPLLDRTLVIAAARQRLVSLRLARWGSLLVHRDAVEEFGPPRADYSAAAADLEWTARILRERPGYLVPGSIVVRSAPETGLTPDEVRDRIRMVRGDCWVAQEPVWFAFMLAVDLARAGRERPAGLARLLAGATRARQRGA